MNAFDEKYDFRFAKLSDVGAIMEFVKSEWKANHIFATDRDFLLSEFGDGDFVQFVLAVNRQSGKTDGMIGFLLASKDPDCLDIWSVMWKITARRPVMPFLGIELMERLMQMTKCRTEIGVGANPMTSIPILKMELNFWVGKMDHYYRLSDRSNFRIAMIKEFRKSEKIPTEPRTLKEYHGIDELADDFHFEKEKTVRPYKDSWYIGRRFFHHPVYKYCVYGVQNSQRKTEAILVGRPVECNGSRIFRIVDYIGDEKAFCGLYDTFTELLKGYEYIDFYCYGLEEKSILGAGFVKRDENDGNIIPNYFEPFVRDNVDIWINSSKAGCRFFKADGDQDRPNIIFRDAERS